MSETTNITKVRYFGPHGDLAIHVERGALVITIQDRRGANQRTAGITLAPERLMEIGNALVQLGYGISMDSVDFGNPSAVTHTAMKQEVKNGD